MILFDTHAHLDDPRYDEDRDQMIVRMAEAGVTRCITVGTRIETSRAAVALAAQRQDVYAIVGSHPHNAATMTDAHLEEYIGMVRSGRAVAIGEIGLDYHYDLSPHDIQRDAFAKQLDAVCALNVPVSIHIREAHGDALDILTGYNGRLPRGIIHCYSGSWESAKAYMDMGFSLSFGGVLTFKNAAKSPEIVAAMPLDRLLLETDCPYLAPVPYRGKRNEPAYIAHVAIKAAELRGMTPDQLAEATTGNAMRMFGIDG